MSAPALDLRPAEVQHLRDRLIADTGQHSPDGCWTWQGSTNSNGYGLIWSPTDRRLFLAHRVSWVLLTGQSLSGGLSIDHLCFNPPCVNPAHLEPVTQAVNNERKIGRKPYAPRIAPAQVSPEVRARALAYYHQNREAVLERRSVLGKAKTACTYCGLEVRRDGMRRHLRRKHGWS